MAKLSGFKNLIPILKNNDLLPSLYNLKSQTALDRFLKKHNIVLSLEEIEKLWDLIDICKPYYKPAKTRQSASCKKNSLQNTVPDEEIDISGGIAVFSDKVNTLLGLIEQSE